MCDDDWDDDSFLTKRSIRTIRVFWVCYARGPDFRAGGKLLFWAGFAYFCLCIVWRVWFCEKRCFGRLRSCSYSWERIQSSFLKVSLMNALVCMQAKKRRLHAVPSCGSDRLKLHFREGSVADISHGNVSFSRNWVVWLSWWLARTYHWFFERAVTLVTYVGTYVFWWEAVTLVTFLGKKIADIANFCWIWGRFTLVLLI